MFCTDSLPEKDDSGDDNENTDPYFAPMDVDASDRINTKLNAALQGQSDREKQFDLAPRCLRADEVSMPMASTNDK